MYEDWSATGKRAHPEMIGRGHLKVFIDREQVFDGGSANSPVECLFARKFSDDSPELLEAIDRIIARKDSDKVGRESVD